MFDNLTNHLSRIIHNISNRGRLTEKNIKDTLREVRIALLEADVALPVVRDFINQVQEKAVGQEINNSLSPGQKFIEIVHQELVVVMGKENNNLNLATQPPAVILLSGLQGVGKTTSVGKIGKFLHEKYKKKLLLVSTDIYRPAAIRQLELLSHQANVDFFKFKDVKNPIDIANAALKEAKIKFYDVLLVDTAGRMHINEFMMKEIREIYNSIKPIETLFVIDAMTGQDAVNIAKKFNEILPITGIILSKMDGDARGGVALSIRYIIGKPIKFFSTGEKIESLELFHPERIASRILGMGDILSIIEDINSKFNQAQTEKLAIKLKKGDAFDFTDFLEQLHQIKNIGNMDNLIDKLPSGIKFQIDDKILVRTEAIINSMTLKERAKPEIINSSRKRRIATGCGMQVQDVNRLLKNFENVQRTMKKGEIVKIMRGIKKQYCQVSRNMKEKS